MWQRFQCRKGAKNESPKGLRQKEPRSEKTGKYARGRWRKTFKWKRRKKGKGNKERDGRGREVAMCGTRSEDEAQGEEENQG